jgi:hypothetical protein
VPLPVHPVSGVGAAGIATDALAMQQPVHPRALKPRAVCSVIRPLALPLPVHVRAFVPRSIGTLPHTCDAAKNRTRRQPRRTLSSTSLAHRPTDTQTHRHTDTHEGMGAARLP